MSRIVKLYYQDHNADTVAPAKALEPPSCLCSAVGEVVYEDDQWIRLCHERSDIDGKDEELAVTAIRKADVTAIEELVFVER